MKLFFIKLFSILTKHDKRFLFLLIFASILMSLIEMIGVSAILPFISIASDFSHIHSNSYIEQVYLYFDFNREIDFVLISGIILLCFYFLRSLLNLFYFYLLSRFSKGRYSRISYRLFENNIGMSYRSFIDRNSSELTKIIVNEASNLTTLMFSLMSILSEIFVAIFIYSIMLYINWKVTALISIILLINILFLTKMISPIIKRAGVFRERHEKKFFSIIHVNLANFKMIKLVSNIKPILEEFQHICSEYAKVNIRNDTLSQFPRLFLEAISFGIVIFMVLYLIDKNQSDVSSSLPMISMFILGLYRLMPSANRILSGYNQVLFYKSSLDTIYTNLQYNPEKLGNTPIFFEKSIQFHQVCFGYNKDKPILSNISFTINKGEKIAFVGESGSGKSTLIDLLVGLYFPQKGSITIDDVPLNENNIKQWRQKIGYIPQSIYLFDGSIAENVAFGKKIDAEKVSQVLYQANILDFLNTYHEGIYTDVGDGGIKLSGGQRQRIAIARALYNEPDILVLDEATSALDTTTEANIMEEIYKLASDKTLIIITHRLSTIEKCEKIYTIRKKELVLESRVK